MKRNVLAVSLVLLCACSSTPERNPDLGGPPSGVRGFPSETLEDIVFSGAHFRADHAKQLRYNFLRNDKVIPVELEVKLHGEGADVAQYSLSQELWEPRLILQDGSVIHAIDIEALVEDLDDDDANVVRKKSFRPGLLDKPRMGFVFFPLEPKRDYRVEDKQLHHKAGGVTRGLDIIGSLLVFRVSKGDVLDDFYVGIRP